jgi:putative ABC transport system permease protein
MYLLKLALRNLFRNKRRTILTMITVIIGIMGFIFSHATVRGIEQSFVRTEITTESGHLRITRTGYLKEEEILPLDLPLVQPQKLRQAIEKQWPQAAVVERLVFTGQIGDGKHLLTVRGVAIDSEAAERAFKYSKYTQQQTKLPPSGDVIYLPLMLARSFKKAAGDHLNVMVRTREGSLNLIDFKILDIINTGNMMIDSTTIYMPLQTGRNLLNIPTEVTDLVVMLPSKDLAPAASKLVVDVTQDANKVETWIDKAKMILELNQVRRKLLSFLVMMILLIAAAGIANTLLMSGFERRGEIGMMTAMGLQRSHILGLFAVEAGFLSLIASSIGALFGGSLAYYFQVYGLDVTSNMNFDSFGGGGGTMSFSSVIYFDLHAEAIIIGIALGVVIGMLAALWPAWRVTRFEPREILSGS